MDKKVKDIFLNTLRNSVPASHKLEQVAALQSKLNIVGKKNTQRTLQFRERNFNHFDTILDSLTLLLISATLDKKPEQM